MKAICYLLAEFMKLPLLNLPKIGCWEAGSIIKIIVKISYR